MAKNEVPEIRLALFGASASGKTTFLSSYFGNQQRHSFEESFGYHLEAEDISDGNSLLAQYYRMEKGEFPLGTEQFVERSFGLKIGDLPEPSLRITWYDYPGGWWERSPIDASEKQVRVDAFKKLITSDVGVLLIDGMRYQKDGLPYVHHLFDQFRAEARRIVGSLPTEMDPHLTFPKHWILAITKADLFPAEVTAETICKEILAGAEDQIAGIAKAVDSKAFGHQYLLLSAVKGDGTRVADAHRFVGLQLVAPVALLSSISNLAENAGDGTPYGVLKFILERLSALTDVVDQVDDWLPKKAQIITMALKAIGLKELLDNGAKHFRIKQMEAAARGNALEAVGALMIAELGSEEAKKVFFRNQKTGGSPVRRPAGEA
jgi:hypothetical protein